MALKLGKCRLCLKLGDFFSIFTVDNSIQLAEMAMDCAKIKIQEGDGLPDKVCAECVGKLSSAYIFKQQCERSDHELRRNYVPPPGFSASSSTPNRQSSDSAFSSAHTDISTNHNKPSSSTVTPANRGRKRSRESSVSSQSMDYKPPSSKSKRVEELKRSQKKRQPSPTSMDSDFEDTSMPNYSDSDEPLLPGFRCKQCPKEFRSLPSLRSHTSKVHSKDKRFDNYIVNIPGKNIVASQETPKSSLGPKPSRTSTGDAMDSEDKLSCDKCSKSFKLKIMLKRHQETCSVTPSSSPKKELLISLEPIDAVLASPPKDKDSSKNIECEMCTTKFKTIENLEKHMRVVHAAVLKQSFRMYLEEPKPKARVEKKIPVPCVYCGQSFDDYYLHGTHFSSCEKRDDSIPLECTVCHKVMNGRGPYAKHVKDIHFFAQEKDSSKESKENECKVCGKKLPSQELLIAHLAAHMSHAEDDDDSGHSVAEDAVEDIASQHSQASRASNGGTVTCQHCDKTFKYPKSLANHIENVHGDIKTELLDKTDERPSTSLNESSKNVNHSYDSESDSSAGEEDMTCDICEKQFSYKRLLIQHKKTKHNMSSGHKRAKINLKDCLVRCLICDIEMKVSNINEHNQQHISKNIKPRNQYTCAECQDKFKSCSSLANHIKLVHRLKQPQAMQMQNADLADFCEVVVTKSEPLESQEGHNGSLEVPLVAASGLSCHLCGKTLATLISLKRHLNWHNNVGNYLETALECFVCKETFRFQRHYKLHMRGHYTDPTLEARHLTCTVCGRRSKHLRAALAHMNFHKQTRFKTKDYQCSICKRVFQYRKVYLSHMAIHYKRGEGQNAICGNPYDVAASANADSSVANLTCPQCGKVADSEVSLKHHIRWHSSKSSLYGSRHECNICNLQFTNKRTLELHTREHYESENGPYKCTICGKGYIDEVYFRKHVKGHNFDNSSHKKRLEKLRLGKVKCPICNRYYPELIKLIRHLRRMHPESKMIKEDPDAPPPRCFTCKLCAKTFLDEKRFKFHEEAHLRKPEFFKCKFCGMKTVSLRKHRLHVKQRHLTSKYLEDPLKCPRCEDTFVRGYDIHHHLRDVHGVDEEWIADRLEEPLGPLKELQCSVCLKVLASKGNFERHIDYHNSLRCNYCFDYFSSLKFLEGHLAFHCEKKQLIGDTEVYPKKVKCPDCYKAFHLQVKLDCHLRTQHNVSVCKEASEGKQQIVCDFCFRVFENEYALTQHKLYHRTVGYYGCIYCPRKFNTIQTFKRHKTAHLNTLNPDEPTKCEHCDETFVAFRDMIDHMKDFHGDDKEWLIMPKEVTEDHCKICNKTFWNVSRHLKYHEENRCKKCGEYFFSRVDYDSHLCDIESEDEIENNENDIRPKYEECTFCFKPITRKSTKRKHDQLHSGSGSISCRFCTHKFKTLDAFNIHSFSHRNRKYTRKPIKCRICKEKFVKYGLFTKHMKGVHKTTKKMHYRAQVKPERCVVCGDDFPNLHNHYRSHLQNQCQLCFKYISSSKLFETHKCDEPDPDPTKVFTSDENLTALIKSYIPKDMKDDEKFYGYTDDEEGEETPDVPEQIENLLEPQNDESPDSIKNQSEEFVQPFIISDVLSLYEKKEELLALYNKSQQDLTVKKKPKPKTYGPKSRRQNGGDSLTDANQSADTSKMAEDAKQNGGDSDVEIVNLSDDSGDATAMDVEVIMIDDDD